MRGLILGLVVALALMAPLGPGRQASADALCAPYGSAWNRARASGSLTAMDQVIAQIPASCSRELVNAKGERAEIVRQRAAAEKARQAQEALARQEAQARQEARMRAVLEEQARLRAEREEAARVAAKKAQDERDEQARVEAAKPYSIKICNRSGEVVFIAVGYHPPSNTQVWNFAGWYKKEDGECHTVETDHTLVFYYAMSTGQKWTWSGKKDNYCINKEDRFAFTMTAPAGRTCDTKEVTVPYGEVVATSKDYTHNLNAATK